MAEIQRHHGLALRGTVWVGGSASPLPGAMVLVDAAGVVTYIGPAGVVDLPEVHGDWIGPTLVDSHVHLAFGAPELAFASGVGAVRDLGAPAVDTAGWRAAAGPPVVALSGPILTSVGGYPDYSWGAGGFARFVADPAAAELAVAAAVAAGADVIKLALQPAPRRPAPSADVAAAVVQAAHRLGRAVTAHALTVPMVERALEVGVDELAHVPTERLSICLVRRIAESGVVISSTLLPHSGVEATLENAADLVRTGARLVYGTDLGNAGTRPGAEPRELALLSDAGLGPWGALRAATEGAAAVAGLHGRVPGGGRLVVGQQVSAVVLSRDAVRDPTVWRTPTAVVQGVRVSQ